MIDQNVLRKSSVCRGLSEDELFALGEVLSVNAFKKVIPANESLMKLGVESRYIYLLEQGMIRAVNFTETGEEIFFYYFSEGALIGLLNSIIKAKNQSEYISVRRCLLYAIPVENFERALDTLPFLTPHYICCIVK